MKPIYYLGNNKNAFVDDFAIPNAKKHLYTRRTVKRASFVHN